MLLRHLSVLFLWKNYLRGLHLRSHLVYMSSCRKRWVSVGAFGDIMSLNAGNFGYVCRSIRSSKQIKRNASQELRLLASMEEPPLRSTFAFALVIYEQLPKAGGQLWRVWRHHIVECWKLRVCLWIQQFFHTNRNKCFSEI